MPTLTTGSDTLILMCDVNAESLYGYSVLAYLSGKDVVRLVVEGRVGQLSDLDLRIAACRASISKVLSAVGRRGGESPVERLRCAGLMYTHCLSHPLAQDGV